MPLVFDYHDDEDETHIRLRFLLIFPSFFISVQLLSLILRERINERVMSAVSSPIREGVVLTEWLTLVERCGCGGVRVEMVSLG